MDLWFFLMEIVMLLGGAFLLGALAQRLRQSPILGYILAGAIVGPFLFNASAVNQAAELGVSLLLFSIGLEFSFKQLRQMGRMAFGGGALQVIATILIVGALLLTRVDIPQAITIGAIVALSSTAVVLRLLVDRAAIDSVRGRTALGILLLQDIAIVPLVILVSLFAPTAPDTSLGPHILKILAAVVGLAVIFYLLLYHVAPLLLSSRTLFANREMTVLLAISVGLGSAWAAHAVNISPALGAFIAGMLLGESSFAVQIRADIGSLRIIMVTLFFASIGMLLKPFWFLTHLHWILLVAVLIFILKTIIIYIVLRIFGLNSRQSLATGITLGQIGEFSFVLAAAAREGTVLDSYSADLIFSVIIVLMLATPYMVTMAIPLTDRFLGLFSRRTSPLAAHQPLDATEPTNQVLVVGLGPAGRQVIEAFIEKKWNPVVIDVNPRSREYARKVGVKFHLGDACQEDILVHAGIAEACMAVVTVPDTGAAIRIIQMIRLLTPAMNIAARCRYSRHLNNLKKAGADMVIDEEMNMGQMLSQKIIESIGESSGANIACRLAGQKTEETD